MLACCWSVLLTAGDVTPEKALQQATDFMNQRVATGSRRAPVTSQQLTMTQQVSGLYVFNVTNNGGFVIVSNDDVATPVLGYSDSGSFDPDNIPSNMKAWLQGYADEIAWAKSHPVTAKTSRRIASAVKTPVLPLIKTQWYQDYPYNALAPFYGVNAGNYVYSTTGTESGIEWFNCATGCVATALAQVMNYYQWPATTTAIPSYQWGMANVTLSGLPPFSFDWTNMKSNYSSSYTSEEATAIAYLMRYCGQAVQMNYGIESGASSGRLSDALTNYFGYNTTAKLLTRSFYSYDNWIEILYHELSQNRPVLYGGQSSGGGHEFICDGYQGEDYFHINWGWGGESDGFFKLSVLNPREQGIGGSSSRDGYHFGQDAVVGIQKPSDTGTVLDLPTNKFNLQLNSISIDKTSVAEGNPVKVTVNVSNTGTDDYDGDVWLGTEEMGLLTGGDFYIPHGESKNCVINYSPSGFTGTIKIRVYKPEFDNRYYTLGDQNVTLEVTAGGGGGASYPTTDNIDLAVTLTSIENSNAGMTEFYDKVLNATITVSNPSLSANYSGTFYLYIYGGGWIRSQYGPVNIPAGGSIEWRYTLDNLVTGSDYHFAFTQQKAGGQTAEQNFGTTFRPYEGIATFAADGTKTTVKATSDYSVPAGALVVDLTGASVVTSVTPNSQPNCIYIYKGSKPSGLDGKNVIEYKDGAYTASNITLTDGNDFYSPIDFTASNIEFTFSNDRWADGTKGWNTIMLPFDVKTVTANGTTIDWFHSDSDTDKQFWLKEFTSDDKSTVNFSYTTAMKANTPYIIALPGAHWGTAYDLSGKTIKFIGNDAFVSQSAPSVVTASNYRFVGNTQTVSTENIYCINDEGSSFKLKASGGSPAFRPFFKAGIADRTVSSLPVSQLAIGTDGGTTGIHTIKDIKGKKDDIYYDLNGRRVLYPKRGVYILNGNIVIIK